MKTTKIIRRAAGSRDLPGDQEFFQVCAQSSPPTTAAELLRETAIRFYGNIAIMTANKLLLRPTQI